MTVTTAIWKTSAASTLEKLPDDVGVADNLGPPVGGILPHVPAINTKPFIALINAASKPDAFPVSFNLNVNKFPKLDAKTIYKNCKTYLDSIVITTTQDLTVTIGQAAATALGLPSTSFPMGSITFVDAKLVKAYIATCDRISLTAKQIEDESPNVIAAVQKLEDHLNSLVNTTGSMTLVSTAKMLKTARDVDPSITDKNIKDFYKILESNSISSITTKVNSLITKYTQFKNNTNLNEDAVNSMLTSIRTMATEVSNILAPNLELLQRAQIKTSEISTATGLIELFGKSEEVGSSSSSSSSAPLQIDQDPTDYTFPPNYISLSLNKMKYALLAIGSPTMPGPGSVWFKFGLSKYKKYRFVLNSNALGVSPSAGFYYSAPGETIVSTEQLNQLFVYTREVFSNEDPMAIRGIELEYKNDPQADDLDIYIQVAVIKNYQYNGNITTDLYNVSLYAQEIMD